MLTHVLTFTLGNKIEILLFRFAITVASLIFVIVIVKCVLKLIALRYYVAQPFILLELTPPATFNKSPEVISSLFSALHGLSATRSLKYRILHHKVIFSVELTSTKQDGIRYIIRLPAHTAASVEQTIHSYLPDTRIRQTADYLPAKDKGLTTELKQTGHYAYPLRSYKTYQDYDPVTHLTGLMTKLLNDELISLQIVASPVKMRQAGKLAQRIIHNQEIVTSLGQNGSWPNKILRVINTAALGLLDVVGSLVHGQSQSSSQQALLAHKQQAAMNIKPARTLSPFELELAASVHNKLCQPLYRTSIRLHMAMNDHYREQERYSGISQWLASIMVPGYQLLRVRRQYMRLQVTFRYWLMQHRLPSLLQRNDCILSASELADMYHFPARNSNHTEDMPKLLTKALPAPLAVKNSQQFAVVIGKNTYHGVETIIGLTKQEREKHVYIIGGTGNGKTTMLQYQIVQDMRNGKGVAVIDPHGDMAETLLKYVPKARLQDVVYFNPDDLDYPIGLNLLELNTNLTGTELLREKDVVTESVVSVFRKIFSEDDSGGHRIEYVLRNAIQTALTIEDATIFTVFELLTSPSYRRSVIRTLDDQNLKNFWNNELGKAGDMQKVKMAAGITAKIGRFLFSASARSILEQPKSTIDCDDIINSGKILICNLSKGLLGEDTSELFGITILAKLQLASLRRARLNQIERRPFYLYVDEFQNFATQSFVQMLSESRKYKLFMTMSEQSTSQQKDQQMVNIILANVGSIICFRTGNPQDERLLLPLFTPSVDEGEISNLAPFTFYAKLSALRVQEPVSGQTVLLPNQGSDASAQAAIDHSRKAYAKQQTTRRPATDSLSQNESDTQLRGDAAKPELVKMIDMD